VQALGDLELDHYFSVDQKVGPEVTDRNPAVMHRHRELSIALTPIEIQLDRWRASIY
jgi:hypothetical protein